MAFSSSVPLLKLPKTTAVSHILTHHKVVGNVEIRTLIS